MCCRFAEQTFQPEKISTRFVINCVWLAKRGAAVQILNAQKFTTHRVDLKWWRRRTHCFKSIFPFQKLAGNKRRGTGRHKPWLLESWGACAHDPSCRRRDPEGCEHVNIEDIQDVPIELRRLEEETDLPSRRQTFACSSLNSSSLDNALGLKSKSLTDIISVSHAIQPTIFSCTYIRSHLNSHTNKKRY